MTISKKELKKIMGELKDRGEDKIKIIICAGTACVSSGSLEIHKKIKEKINELDLNVEIELQEEEVDQEEDMEVKTSGCHGFCDEGPLVRIDPIGILYTHVEPEDAEKIVQKTIKNGEIIEELTYKTSEGETYVREEEIPFYNNQERISLKNAGKVDPEDLKDYESIGGYDALKKAVKNLSPEEVIEEVKESGLRGRGGAGFPTGKKWGFTYQEDADQKYVVVNCDEGDPGAFMDRSLMEGDPHRVIEGAALAGYATQASKGYVYVRAEYPLAVSRIKKAINDAYEAGLLGKEILGTNFEFDLEVKEGAGAFVCGEETALIASIEGKKGRPSPKPPYPAQSGLWGKPTTINNVETLANIPNIIEKGADWFTSIGSESSPGTKTFAVTGDVSNTGLIEVPMGISLREIIYDVAGGLDSDKDLKAVQIGGPSGGCLSKEHLDIPLGFDTLQEVGAMVGSGGLVVMDEDNCMVDVARFFLEFTQEESCGKCPPCRIGTKKMLEILERITEGEGEPKDIERLESLADTISSASLCGLGQTAPNPITSTLEHFREEYEAHIHDEECPAGECPELVDSYKIDADTCVGCGQCVSECPADAISGEQGKTHEIDAETCIVCGACAETCPVDAISN